MISRAIGVFALAFVVIVGGGALYVYNAEPSQRAPWDGYVDRSDIHVRRGEYLANHVSVCMDCHSARDSDRLGYPPTGGALGAGDPACESKPGADFVVCAPNITPDVTTGLGAWTDGEIMRAFREGVDRDGEALFPMCPYTHLRSVSDRDARAIVAYLRSLNPKKQPTPARKLPFPLDAVVTFMPRPLEGPVGHPSDDDAKSRGRYLATIGGCAFCHTPVDSERNPVESKAFSGGQRFPRPGGSEVVSTNLTPHADGLSRLSKEQFITLFKRHMDPATRQLIVKPEDNTVMPWQSFAGMSEDDLGAIYAYLAGLDPIAGNALEATSRDKDEQP